MISGLNVETIELTSGLTHTIDITDFNVKAFILYGSPTLLSSIVINYSGTPKVGDIVKFYYVANVTGRNTIKIFDTFMSEHLFGKKVEIICVYNGSSYVVTFLPSNDNDGIILANNIPDGVITPDKLSNIGDGKILIGDGLGVNEVSVSGDATIINTGELTIENNAITTAKINDGAITTAKIDAAAVTPDNTDTSLNTQLITVPVSFETGFLDAAIKVKIPYKCTVTNCYACVTSEIENTDDGVITLYDNGMTSMKVLTIAKGENIGYGVNENITSNNSISANEFLHIKTEKATAGGTVLLSITVIKTT